MRLNEIAKNAYETALKRQNNGAEVKIKDILKHCAGEVIEAQEAFIMWKYEAHPAERYGEELADVIICELIAAARDKIDIEKAVSDKLKKNAERAALQGDKL